MNGLKSTRFDVEGSVGERAKAQTLITDDMEEHNLTLETMDKSISRLVIKSHNDLKRSLKALQASQDTMIEFLERFTLVLEKMERTIHARTSSNTKKRKRVDAVEPELSPPTKKTFFAKK